MTTTRKKGHLAPPARKGGFWAGVLAQGRLILFFVVLLGLLGACGEILYFVATGALSYSADGGGKDALQYLGGAFSPSLGIMGAYYFSERKVHGRHAASTEAFIFSLVVTAIASLAPAIVIVALSPTALALDWLRAFAPFAQAPAAGAITFYFSRGATKDDSEQGAQPGKRGASAQRASTAAGNESEQQP